MFLLKFNSFGTEKANQKTNKQTKKRKREIIIELLGPDHAIFLLRKFHYNENIIRIITGI